MKVKRVLLFASLLPLSACSLFSGGGLTPSTNDPFSIVLNNYGGTSLAISYSSDFSNPTNSITVSNSEMKPFEEYTYAMLPPSDELDKEANSYSYGAANDQNGNCIAFYFFACTFFVKNTKNFVSAYDFTVNLSEKNVDGSLVNSLRVMVFENDVTDSSNVNNHDYRVYAKEAAGNNHLKDGTITNQEFVGYNSIGGQEDDNHPLAETFYSPDVVCTRDVANFKNGDMKRYTIVFWLEGEDPQSNTSDEAPGDAKLKLGVEIRAYEEK